MKTSLLALFTTMLAAAASAAPLAPGMSAAIGGGVAAANQLHATTASGLTVTPLAPPAPLVVLAVPVAPVPVFIAPVAIRAR